MVGKVTTSRWEISYPLVGFGESNRTTKATVRVAGGLNVRDGGACGGSWVSTTVEPNEAGEHTLGRRDLQQPKEKESRKESLEHEYKKR